jgi:SAM-dependent methyltransferase
VTIDRARQNPRTASLPCRVCGGAVKEAWPGRLLGHVDVTYALCEDCGSLSLPEPDWLDESYSKVIIPDPDFGSLARTLFVHRCIRRLRASSAGVIPRRCRTLDFGSGKGFLIRLLLDEAKDAWGFDPYPQAIFAQDRIFTALPDGPFDLITAIEVLEHATDPVGILRSLRERLAPDGTLLLSTELFDAEIHGADWHYLAPEHGQHITFYSREGLRRVAQAADLAWIGSMRYNRIDFLHVLLPNGRRVPSRWTWWRLRLRHRLREKRLRRDRNV